MEELKTEQVNQVENIAIASTTEQKIFTERPKYIMLEKTKALYTLMHTYLELFPKSEKFTLRQKMEDTILELIKLLIMQNYQQTDEERRKKILDFLANLYLLEVLLQQASIFRYLSFDGFNRCVLLLREINNFALARYKNLGGQDENI
jgi:hypothetical protein